MRKKSIITILLVASLINGVHSGVHAIVSEKELGINQNAVFEITDLDQTTGCLNLAEVFWFDDITVSSGQNTSKAIYTDKGVTANLGSGFETTATVTIGSEVDGTPFEILKGKTLNKINAIDETSDSKWNGYVELKVNVTSKGKYKVHILGSSKERAFKISSGNSTITTEKIGTSAKEEVKIVTAEFELDAGENIIKITGAPAPNFLAAVVMSENSEVKTITSENIDLPDSAKEGDIVSITTPEGYVENSLLVTYNDGSNVVPVNLYKDEDKDNVWNFIMPPFDTYAGCIVNNNADKEFVVGNNSNYFVRNDSSMDVVFDIPQLDPAFKYSSANISIPVRAHGYNARNMNAVMNGASIEVDDQGFVSGIIDGAHVQTGTNILTITNENTSGVDYYHNSAGHYPQTIDDLSVMILNKEEVDLRISAVLVDEEEYGSGEVLPSGVDITGVLLKRNLNAEVQSGDVYTALYKDDNLISVRKNEINSNIFNGEDAYIQLKTPISVPAEGENGYALKVFTWGENIVPLTLAFKINTLKKLDENEMSLTSLWYDEPAADDGNAAFTSFNGSNDQNDPSHLVWKEKALPIGNGYMGAMIFGGVAQERIQLNEKTLWNGKPNHINNDRSTIFEQAREYMYQGDTTSAYNNIKQLWGSSSNYGSYTAFGNLSFDFTNIPSGTKYENYRRWLDLDNSIQNVKYDIDGVTYMREYFASYPDRLMAVKFSSEAVDNISFNMSFSNKPNNSKEITEIFEDNTLKVTGKLSSNDLRWSGEYKIVNNGGTVTYKNGIVTVDGADEVMVIMTMATDYEFNEEKGYRSGIDPADITSEIISNVSGKSFEELYETHREDYSAIYNNVSLDLNGENDIATDDMHKGYAETNTPEQDRMYDQLFYQYARYMMISSSRSGSLPANLQGVWNDQEHPAWESDYHININLQMNYYPAANGNMIECMEPLLDWVEKTAELGKRTAKNVYGCEGWVSHTCNNAFGFTDPGWGDWGIAPESAAWICMNLWDMYEYTGDETHLPRIFNVIQEAVRFYTDYMYYDETNDVYVAGPSYSPENGPMTMGVKISQQLVKQIYSVYLTACGIESLSNQVDGTLKDEVTEQISKIQAPVEIGAWGNIKEWNEYQGLNLEEDNSHRHISHLLALHPLNQITRRTPDFLRAARTTLNARGDEATGWSRAFKTLLWARAIGMDNDAESTSRGDQYVQNVSNADRAYSIYQGQVKYMLFDNMFDFHGATEYDTSREKGIFQIDGNFGSCAAMGEFLVQSHDGYIDILPSLPTAWSESGSVDGILAKGGFETSVSWIDGKPLEAAIVSNVGNECKIYINEDYGTPTVTKNGELVEYTVETVETTVEGETFDLIVFDTEEDAEYMLVY